MPCDPMPPTRKTKTVKLSGKIILLLLAFGGGNLAVCGADEVSENSVKLPASIPGMWRLFGRGEVKSGSDSVTISGGYVADLTPLTDCEVSFRARMPADAPQVQIWGAIRIRDRLSRYVFALRGGASPEVYLARYAPDNGSKFLGFAPIDFTPKPGEWYTLRAMVQGKRFQVYVNDNKLPSLNIEDKDATWTEGGVALGGGWLPAEFSDVKAGPLAGDGLASFTAAGDDVWTKPEGDKEAIRASQRAAYQPAKIDKLPEVRGEVSLDGNWLFMPDQMLSAPTPPTTAEFSDESWHVIPVPSFWTPTLAWIGMGKKINDPRFSMGPWDSLAVEEYYRVEAQTFDWRNTTSGWYRHHLDLPSNVTGKEFNLVFDAVAKISEVYVNGTAVGTSTGMFRRAEYDISKQLKSGDNVIAVHVITPAGHVDDSSKVAAVAVTVNVTNDMIKSMPHGMTDNASGIWQPVKLVVTNPVRVGGLFIQPRLDGASADIDLVNGDAQDRAVTLSYTIRDYKDQSVLLPETAGVPITVPANGKVTTHIDTAKLQPKLWSPSAPNLYILTIKLASGASVIDQQETRFGFRTFTVDGSRLMLNGKPYWLRGGNHFPAIIRPNDAVLAHKFIELAKEGNVEVTRTHALPFTQTWLDASDELGMGVSYEGTWPWLMIKGEPPPPDLLKIWKDEFSDLLRENRNHPSVLFWTVNNEMNFARFDEKDDALLDRKWTVLSDMIKTMRQIDPTRPIVAYSGYHRGEAMKSFNEVVTPKHYDDGDIDDSHSYYTWYNESFFHLFAGEYGKKQAVANRPLISQEMSTGYPRNDDWPSRGYDFQRQVAQSLVGDFCMEENDPSIFLTRQAFATKELAEVIRRTNRDEAAGVLHFAYVTWFTDVWKADQIKPKLTYYELKKGLQPVLVSAELTGRHFYAGETASRRVCLVNDDTAQQLVPAGKLTWEIRSDDKVLSQGALDTPEVPYYTNKWLDIDYAMPKELPSPRVNAKLVLTWTAGGRAVSANDYDIVIATHDWASVPSGIKVQLLDPSGKAKEALAGIETTSVATLDAALPTQPLIIGDAASLNADDAAKLKTFVEGGGHVLLLQPGKALTTLFPDFVKSYRAVKGEVVSMQVPESSVFDGIEPLDTAWFEMGQGNLPQACSGTYGVDRSRPEVRTLATECDFHSAEPKPDTFFNVAGSPLVEIRLGSGLVLASEMLAAPKDKDPIAGRLLANMITTLVKGTY
jgi:hypothetical protein